MFKAAATATAASAALPPFCKIRMPAWSSTFSLAAPLCMHLGLGFDQNYDPREGPRIYPVLLSD